MFKVLFRSPDGSEMGHMEFEVLELSRDQSVRWRVKWATCLLSLKELVETGKGRPAPDEREDRQLELGWLHPRRCETLVKR